MARTDRLTGGLPEEVRDLMTGLGANLRLARRRRKMSLADLAERLMVSSPTLRKLEMGDPTVSLGVMVTTLWVLGLGDAFKALAAPETDGPGLRAEMQRLSAKGRKAAPDDLDF